MIMSETGVFNHHSQQHRLPASKPLVSKAGFRLNSSVCCLLPDATCPKQCDSLRSSVRLMRHHPAEDYSPSKLQTRNQSTRARQPKRRRHKDRMDGMRCLVRRLFVHPSMPSCVLVLCPRVTAIGAAYLALAKSTTDRSSDGDADKHRGMQTEGRTQTMKIGELKATAHHPFVRPFVRPSVR